VCFTLDFPCAIGGKGTNVNVMSTVTNLHVSNLAVGFLATATISISRNNDNVLVSTAMVESSRDVVFT
jgi:hypothetical protein